MPITLRGAQVLRDLSNMDFRVLNMIETLLRKGEYAPVDKIVSYSKYRDKDVDLILSKLNKLKLTRRWSGGFVGYTLTLSGFDALALNTLYNKKIVYGVGNSRGVGKESDIYHAIDFENNEIMLKINRTGRASFQNIKRKRDFLDGRFHYSIFSTSTISAKREFEILSKLQNKNLPIPEVYGHNRHIIAMNIVEGIELINVREIRKPIKILEKIIEFAKTLYQEHQLVHADLTEYNILFDERTEEVTIIDFPQAVDIDHPEAEELLRRDFNHFLDYFGKKWGVSTDDNETVIEYIIGKK
jgi:RIO kinase 2